MVLLAPLKAEVPDSGRRSSYYFIYIASNKISPSRIEYA